MEPAVEAEAVTTIADLALEPWLEIVLLVAAGLPLVRLLCKAPVRREARAHPAVAVVFVAVAGVALAAAIWGAARSPSALRAATLVALAIAAAAYVRARPAYGARRNLPPGSLGWAVSLDAITQEDFYARAARRWGPVFKMSQFHRPVVCVTDLKLGFEFIGSEAASLEQLGQPWGSLIPGGYLEFMNGARHEHYRALLRRPLSAAVVAATKNEMAAIVRHELQALARDPSGDIQECLIRITSLLLVRVFFGVTPGTPETYALLRSFADIDRRMHFAWRPPPKLEADVLRMTETVRRLAGTHHDRLSVVSELVRTSPETLDDPTVVGNLVFMVQIARSTLAGMMFWLLKLAADHPRWMHELRLEHESGADTVASHFVSEMFRLWQSEYVYRRTLRACRIGGHRVPAGWLVRVCLREAHGREEVFPAPAVFDPARFAARRYGKDEYAPFSDGPHACFGAVLTTTVGRTFLHELARGFELRVLGDGPPERSNRHWAHWRPGAGLCVALTAR